MEKIGSNGAISVIVPVYNPGGDCPKTKMNVHRN